MNRILRRVILLGVLFVVVSCESDENFDFPINNDPSLNYKYTSSSVYYKSSGKVLKELSSEGSLYFNKGLSSVTVNVTPAFGWDYQLNLTNLVDRDFGDGTTITTFTIGTQQESVNYVKFSIEGNASVDVPNASGGSLGLFDGYFTATELVFGFKSKNIEEQSWVISKLTGTKVN